MAPVVRIETREDGQRRIVAPGGTGKWVKHDQVAVLVVNEVDRLAYVHFSDYYVSFFDKPGSARYPAEAPAGTLIVADSLY